MSEVLKYCGDITETIDRDQMLGPDFGHRYLAVRAASYDSDTDLTTVTLRGIAPDEFRAHITPLVRQQQERERIRKLFNAQ